MSYSVFSMIVISTLVTIASGLSAHAGGRIGSSRLIERRFTLNHFSVGERNFIPHLESHLRYRLVANPNLDTNLVRVQVLKAMNEFYESRSLTKDSFGSIVTDAAALADFAVGFSGRVFLSGEAFSSYKSSVIQYVTESKGFSVRVRLPDNSFRTIDIEPVSYKAGPARSLENHFILSLNKELRSVREELSINGDSKGQFITVESITPISI